MPVQCLQSARRVYEKSSQRLWLLDVLILNDKRFFLLTLQIVKILTLPHIVIILFHVILILDIQLCVNLIVYWNFYNIESRVVNTQTLFDVLYFMGKDCKIPERKEGPAHVT